jgi:diadenylate cyclase
MNISDAIDIAIVAVFIYAILAWIRRAKSGFVLVGMFIIGVLYLVSRQFQLHLTTGILHAFFAVVIVAMIVIFQEDIRRFFERVASFSLGHRRKMKSKPAQADMTIDLLTETLLDLAASKVGALIILAGRDRLDRHLIGGVPLDGLMSKALISSIFDTHTGGHDGAVVIRDSRVLSYGSHLPLSSNVGLLRELGTRHAAGLGISERSDALALVVSEERGIVSYARNGVLKESGSSQELRQVIAGFYEAHLLAGNDRSVARILTGNAKMKVLAAAIAVTLWVLFVHESRVEYRNMFVTTQVSYVPQDMQVIAVTPDSVEVLLVGPKRVFYFFDREDVSLSLRLFDAQETALSVHLSPADFKVPEGISIDNIRPDIVFVTLAKPGPEGQQIESRLSRNAGVSDLVSTQSR